MKLASKEINEEIAHLVQLISQCENDDDVFSSSEKFQKHTHKIKGLAPMMGKEDLGELSGTMDSILKKIIDGNKVKGMFSALTESITLMEKSMTESNYDLSDFKNTVSKILDSIN